MALDCLCVGILFADHVCSPIERMPQPGELIAAEKMQVCLGGCASNAALDLVRLGVQAGVIGCVGDDAFGQFILDALRRGGVDTAGIRCLADIHSASTMVINVQGEDRRFVSSPGANTRLTPGHIPAEAVRQAKVLYIGGYLMMPGLETEAMLDVMRASRAAGNTTVLDVVYMTGPGRRRAVELLLPETDVFLPNDDEAALLTGLHDPMDQARAFRDAGARTVVITLGQRGSLLVSDKLKLQAGVYPTTFVGGTGAGDAFDAGFIAGLLAGADPAGCLRWGSALGASCVRSLAATESVFTRAEAEAFMREHVLEIHEVS